MIDVHGTPTPAEDEFFRRQDAELITRARANAVHTQNDLRVVDEQRVLGATLGIDDHEVVARLYGFGLRPDTAWLLAWVPAVEVARLAGVDGAERACLRDLIAKIATDAPVEALLDSWFLAPPEFFESARLGLRLRLAGMSEAEREQLRERVLAGCVAVGRASGGVLGFGSLSAEERRCIDAVRSDLERAP